MMDVCVFSKPPAQENIVICKKFYELAIMVPGLYVYTLVVVVVSSCLGSRLFIGDKVVPGLTRTGLVCSIENLVLA